MTDTSLAYSHPRSLPEQALELAHARRLAVSCETAAAAAKNWAVIVQGRLNRPLTNAAVDVAADMCRLIATEADELRKAAVALEDAIYRQHQQ
jgi:hypothetical protein